MSLAVRLFALLCAFVACGIAMAATPATPPALKLGFVETRTLPGFTTPLISHGVLSVDPARGFHWEITAPYHYVFEMHGNEAQEQLPDGSLRRLDPEQAPWLAAVEQIFMGAVSGDVAQLQRYFVVKIAPLAQGRRITLTPKPGALSQAITQIQVTETAPGHPRQIDIRETSGGGMQLRFTPIPPPSNP